MPAILKKTPKHWQSGSMPKGKKEDLLERKEENFNACNVDVAVMNLEFGDLPRRKCRY